MTVNDYLMKDYKSFCVSALYYIREAGSDKDDPCVFLEANEKYGKREIEKITYKYNSVCKPILHLA